MLDICYEVNSPGITYRFSLLLAGLETHGKIFCSLSLGNRLFKKAGAAEHKNVIIKKPFPYALQIAFSTFRQLGTRCSLCF
jgi:hypothetical protein